MSVSTTLITHLLETQLIDHSSAPTGLLEEFFSVWAKVDFQGPSAALLADELPVDCRHGVWVQFVICHRTQRNIGEATVEHDVSNVNASRPEFSCQGLRQPTRAELGAGKGDPAAAHRDDVAPVKSIVPPFRPEVSISAAASRAQSRAPKTPTLHARSKSSGSSSSRLPPRGPRPPLA